jgi:hypothetical protein
LTDDPLYLAVGAIIIRWGMIDTLITQTCGEIIAIEGLNRKAPPVSYEARDKFIRDHITAIHSLINLKDAILACLDDIAKIKPTREMLAHGMLTKQGLRRHRFTKLQRSPKGYVQENQIYTLSELEIVAFACEKILRDLVHVGEQLRELRQLQ